MFQSHPFTIINAPSFVSCLPSNTNTGITLAAKDVGDWTNALNALAKSGEKGTECVTVMVDGPYGGLTVDLGEFEHVLLVAGGTGITFTLSVLDDLVGRIIKLGRSRGERTTKIEFVWYMRSYGKSTLVLYG